MARESTLSICNVLPKIQIKQKKMKIQIQNSCRAINTPQDIIWGEGSAKWWNENLRKHTCTYDKKHMSCYQYPQDIILFYREQLKDVVILSRIFFRTKKPHRYHRDHLIWIGTTKHLCQINFQGTPRVDMPEMTW